MANGEDDPTRGLYGISVAAELVGNGEQNIRLYERRGLVTPARSAGGTRRYSDHDLGRLRRIAELLADGLNLAGVGRVLELEDEIGRLRAERDAGDRR
ncbi:MAG TPA: MerR family transcriptional regulator [Microthrixaceae bacterium]|jgi:DNA-binding transcriptional MerR regulator|nr:MerR family transcriptional regulator [Microthrixaceae bacterium]